MKLSAGILVYRRLELEVEVLLAHPGGPLWSNKDSWTIPKGEVEPGEDIKIAAEREFREETGLTLPSNTWLDLGKKKQSSAKENQIWAVYGDLDISGFSSNEFRMEWPPKSGKFIQVPENDAINWFSLSMAREKLFLSQRQFIDRLEEKLLQL